jgi:hypothetical protein
MLMTFITGLDDRRMGGLPIHSPHEHARWKNRDDSRSGAAGS